MTGASIETTLELWASSLREVKGRINRRTLALSLCLLQGTSRFGRNGHSITLPTHSAHHTSTG